MKVDYVAIKAADPGGTIEAAFASMSIDTEPINRGLYRVTPLMIAQKYNSDLADRIYAGLEAAVTADAMSAWQLRLFESDGVDVNDQKTVDKLAQVVAAGKLNQPDVDSVLAMGTEDILKWPGLKHGHIQNARENNFGRPN